MESMGIEEGRVKKQFFFIGEELGRQLGHIFGKILWELFFREGGRRGSSDLTNLENKAFLGWKDIRTDRKIVLQQLRRNICDLIYLKRQL